MKRKALLAALTVISICLSMPACSKKENAEASETPKPTMNVDVDFENMETEEETVQKETAVKKQTTETTATTTTALNETTTSTTVKMATVSTSTAKPSANTQQTTTKAAARPMETTAATTVSVTRPAPTEAYQETETETVMQAPVLVFVPVSNTDSETPVATVTGAGEESFDVYPDGAYKAINMLDNYHHNEMPNDYSFWLYNDKKVLDYNIPYEYIFYDDGNAHFFNENGEDVYTLNRQDFILLCNCTACEYADGRGREYVPIYERSLIIEVIMNNLAQTEYSSVYGVISSSDSFRNKNNYLYAEDYLSNVTMKDFEAVAMYFCNRDDPLYYHEGYTSFTTDGFWNFFE